MSNENQVGDVVRLKSGGPTMSIVDIKDGIAECTWFTDKQVTNSQKFPLAALAQCIGVVYVAVNGPFRSY